MFIDESVWIRKKLAALDLPAGAEVLNIGSSDAGFRLTQPHIEENVLAPLRARGLKLVNLDIRPAAPGDYSADITEKGLAVRLGKRFRLLICTSLLEHVADRAAALDNIAALAEPGGHILLTVPRRYPRHGDPIDTMYRPSPEELAGEIMARRPATLIAAETLDIRHPRHYYFVSRYPLWGYRKLLFWRRWFEWSRWKMSCALLRAD